jgi:hypothetical protein
LGKGPTIPHHKKQLGYEVSHRASDLDGYFGMTQAMEMDVTFGTWNVMSLYRAGSLKTVSSKLAKYNLHIMTVKEVRLDKVVVGQQMIIHFSTKMRMLIIT